MNGVGACGEMGCESQGFWPLWDVCNLDQRCLASTGVSFVHGCLVHANDWEGLRSLHNFKFVLILKVRKC